MNERWEIHNYGKALNWRLEGIKNGKHCSETNKKQMLEFYEYLFAEGLSIPRVEKYMGLLSRFDKEIQGKDFMQLEKKDIITFLAWLETTNYSEWTKKDYKVGLKKFYKWANNGTLPSHISWIKSGMKNEKKLLPQELLTPEDVLKLINSSNNTRDRAFIGTLYESGCRIGEMLTIKLKHIESDNYGLIIRVNGKTGVRRVRIISTSNLVTTWINNHPNKDSQDTYLWSRMYNGKEMVCYNSIRKILKRAKKNAGINKRVNPHIFRHARATHMANKLTEAQMKEYFGWTQSSDMASVYVHLSGRDVDNAVLKYYGIEKSDEKTDAMQPITCTCGEINTPVNNYCNKCGKPLKVEVAINIDDKKKQIQEFLAKMMQDPETFDKIKEMVQAK